MAEKRLFIDMDGTLAHFTDAVLDEDGQVQIRKMYEPDFFKKLEPFYNIIEGIKLLMNKMPDVDVFILSAAQPGDPPGFIKQKHSWIDKFLPEIDYEHRIFSDPKYEKSNYIPNGIQKNDYLLDDFNKNLEEFIAAGGNGIKCKNNLNHRGLGLYGGRVGKIWKGFIVEHDKNPEEIAKVIESYLNIEIDMKELPEFVLQRQKEVEKDRARVDSLVNEDTFGLEVEQHEGTWHTVESWEINDEMFYRMEHDTYGDTVSSIIVNADGELVAQDLEHGFDRGAMDAVREYLSEKGIDWEPETSSDAVQTETEKLVFKPSLNALINSAEKEKYSINNYSINNQHQISDRIKNSLK